MMTAEQTRDLAKIYYEKAMMFDPMSCMLFATNKRSIARIAAYYTALQYNEELLRKFKKRMLKEQRKQARIERNKKRNRRKADRMKRLRVKKMR